MFIKVNIANLNEFSKLMPLILSNDVKTKKEMIKSTIVRKYLFISFKLKLILENINLFIKIFFGLVNDRIWLNEYFVNEYIFKNLNPELVEKKEPPIITSIKYIKFKLFWDEFSDSPIFDMLLTKDKKLWIKLLSKLENKKNIITIITKYKNKWRSSKKKFKFLLRKKIKL